VVPPEYQDRPDDYVDWMCRAMLPQVRRRKLATFADVYCERGAFTLEQSRRYLSAARGFGFRLKVHADQFSQSGGTQLGIEMGAVSVDHLEQAGAEEAAALSQSGTIATLLPGSVFHLGLERYPPARLLLDSGCAVALATDFNMGTSPTFSMPMVLSLACARMRMTPAEAISASTINGAHALGMAGRVGSLEFGKQADLLVLEASDYRELPYFFGSNPVAQVIKKGRVIVPRPEK
jgi:imidazolonepropionase